MTDWIKRYAVARVYPDHEYGIEAHVWDDFDRAVAHAKERAAQYPGVKFHVMESIREYEAEVREVAERGSTD